MTATEATPRWIVQPACGHVSHWWLAADREDFAALPRTQAASHPCKGEPIVGWGEWCIPCADIVPVTHVID